MADITDFAIYTLPIGDASIAEDVVTSVMSDTRDIAEDARDRALLAIEALGQFGSVSFDLQPVAPPTVPIETVTALPIGEAPAEPSGMEASFPSAPAEPTLGTLQGFEPGSEPVLDVSAPLLFEVPLPDPLAITQPAEPSLNFPARPDAFATAIPAAPDLSNIPVPDAFAGTVPAAPTFNALSAPAAFAQNAPTVPTLNEPERPSAFDGSAPASPTITHYTPPASLNVSTPSAPTLTPLAQPAAFTTAAMRW